MNLYDTGTDNMTANLIIVVWQASSRRDEACHTILLSKISV